MSSGAIFESGGANRHTPLPIALAAESPHPKKKAESARWDAGFWAGGRAERNPEGDKADRTSWHAFLPRAVTHCRFSAASNPVTDMLLVGLSFAMALEFSGLLRTAFAWDAPAARSQWGVIPVLAGLFSLLNSSEGLYNDTRSDPQRVRSILAKSMAWAILLTSAALLSNQHLVVPLGTVAAGGLLAYATLCIWRKWQWWRTAQCRARGEGMRNVLIVGAGALGQEVAEALSRDVAAERTLVGFLDETATGHGAIRGKPADLNAIARAHFVDEVILAIPNQPELAHRVEREARRCRLDIKAVSELLPQPIRAEVEHLGRLPLLTLHEEPLPVLGPLLKRAFDIVFSTASLLAAAPLLAGIALAVKLDSPGPAFYRAPRAGKKGRTFPCFKFRTMMVDADILKEGLRERNERCGPFFKIGDDPRITRLGRLLRRYSMDELPQLWNVLRGEMSVVGPRPHPLDDCQRYQLEYLRRLDVSPGITGLWQVTARHDASFQRGLALDLEYIEHWSFWSDVRILCRTAAVVWKGSGK